ncbi:MAG: fasciclin domain-containing protein [Pyrinomonadaceae bacterium]
MKSLFAILTLALVVGFGVSAVSAQSSMMKKDSMMKSDGNPMVGGAAMYKKKNIVENAMNSADHTTLVAAVKAAGLVGTLSGKGPFTVFAPVNAAFDKLPAGTVDTVLMPENKSMLTGILTYHVVAGKMDSKSIAKAIKKGNGRAILNTVAGGKLVAMMEGNSLVLTDEKGGKAMVTIANVMQSNGVIHVIDSVLMRN